MSTPTPTNVPEPASSESTAQPSTPDTAPHESYRSPTPPAPPAPPASPAPNAPYAPYAPQPQTPPAAFPAPSQTTPPAPRKTIRSTTVILIVLAVVLLPVVACVGAALLAGGFSFFAATSQVDQTATSHFQVTVPDHPVITITNTAGQITVTHGDMQQVNVTATKKARASSSQAARNLLNEITVKADSTANGARITAVTGPSGVLNQKQVNLVVTVPHTSDVTVTMNAGTVTITEISGKLNVTNDAGSVDLRNITLEGASTVSLSAGTLTFNGALAKDASVTATVNTGNANIRLPADSATRFDAKTNVGSISVTKWAATINKSGVGQSTAFDLNPQPVSAMTVRVDVGAITLGAR